MVSYRFPGALVAAGLVFCACPTWSQSFAQNGLVDPGWSDPAFASYLDAARARGATGRDPFGGTVEAPTFTLPVLGLPGVEGVGDAQERSASDGAALSRNVPDWPSCASPDPTVVTVPESPARSAGAPAGSWYTRTFDFGCVMVTLEGDRNDGGAAFADRSSPESGTADVSIFDENAGEGMNAEGRSTVEGPLGLTSPGSANIGLVLGNLTYGVTIDCVVPESYAYCRNTEGLRQFAKKLAVVGGAPSKEQ
ncbi:hypothetical protein [Aureimonas leprariae]|uniref:Uncharacterized protein n=1 Tax=Plantimonas leprariae TaxID=2615207 RepID=A0A7V7PRF8_9HYPH|nr:hypothetical protein [Aureimonas leprariae]KAB0681348.1 hypothetical protein F6X38_05535 [Aureimonas leprariae]